MSNIYDTSIASTVLLETYRSKGYTDYQQALLLANAKIEQAILKTKGVWTKQKLNKIERLIKDELTISYGGLFESIQDESVAIAEINYNAILGNTAITAALPKGAIQDLINSQRPIQMGENSQYGFAELLKGTQEQNIRVLRNTLAGLEAKGDHPYKIARDLTFKSNKLSKGQIRSNIFTILTDAKNQANYEAFKTLEKKGLVKYYEHISVLDEKTSPVCINLDGEKYYKPINEIPHGVRPPIHGNCRSQLNPRTDDNPIVKETGAEWFNRQEDSFKKKMLGNKKFKMYQNGDYKVESLPDMINSSRSLDSYKKDLFDYVKQTWYNTHVEHI